jgi:hypothetical protein
LIDTRVEALPVFRRASLVLGRSEVRDRDRDGDLVGADDDAAAPLSFAILPGASAGDCRLHGRTFRS